MSCALISLLNTRILCCSPIVLDLESRVAKNCPLRPSISKRISLLSGITMGRTFKLCGAIGVKTKLPDLGYKIGPPQLKEYPVDPVGVAMIKPSAQYVFRYSPSTEALMITIEEVSLLCSVKSLRAKDSSPNKSKSIS